MLEIESTFFKDVLIFKNQSYEDSRGSFKESFRADLIEKAIGVKILFCQENIAKSRKGVIRGMHYQMPPHSQSKLVSVVKGKVLDVIIDIRKGSPTFGKHLSVELSEANQKYIFIPRGYAHGYITLSEESIFHYKVDDYYNKGSEGSIAFDDPKLGIDWILPKPKWILSDKDKNHPSLKDAILFDFKTNLYD